MATSTHRFTRLVAAFGLVAALALAPAAADAGLIRGIHRGRALQRNHVQRVVRRNVVRRAVARPALAPRVVGVAPATVVVEPVVVADDYYDFVE